MRKRRWQEGKVRGSVRRMLREGQGEGRAGSVEVVYARKLLPF